MLAILAGFARPPALLCLGDLSRRAADVGASSRRPAGARRTQPGAVPGRPVCRRARADVDAPRRPSRQSRLPQAARHDLRRARALPRRGRGVGELRGELPDAAGSVSQHREMPTSGWASSSIGGRLRAVPGVRPERSGCDVLPRACHERRGAIPRARELYERGLAIAATTTTCGWDWPGSTCAKDASRGARVRRRRDRRPAR